ncbi:serine/threonine protein kinase [Myxococcus stipitatus DSM 14675]|uniref:Serine/threonine protein kinase n=1 Tax=Myxococcus stipitatus (strain DSM 14675 / JCM 12634 / Mx s8) TaxID=1278073 RepID=L7UQ42_MYXSD|nr:protein kinase [Myxococcus stipitatus]AGC48679.1 serine/threonine protein kinase [Myxococcus stipitatus DSM 14675]
MLSLRQGLSIAGRYRLLNILGKGGMGEIWAAYDEADKRGVAIKFMQAGPWLERDEHSRRFEREARLLADIDHPHIVRFLDFGSMEDVPYLVMELLVGEDLASRLSEARRLAAPEIVTLVKDVTAALEKLHDAGVIHRDIKPANIFFATDGTRETVKVIDFGVAKLVESTPSSSPPKTISQTILGTPLYMSPERLRGHEGDARSDLWSFAVVLFEASLGRTPFGDTESYLKELYDASRAAGLIGITLPLEVFQFFQRALAFEPDARFQSARAMWDAFLPLAESLSMLSLPPAAQALSSQPRSSERTGLVELQATDTKGVSPGPWLELAKGLPPKLEGHAAPIALFFDKLFMGFQWMSPNVIQLEGARFPQLDAQPFFAVFATGEDDHLATQAFKGYVDPLEQHLAVLQSIARKVVIAIVDATGLGGGVRGRIFEFQEKFGATVLPVHVGELGDALRGGTPYDFLLDRLSDFHTPPDVFSRTERTVDRTRMFGMSAQVNELTRLLRQGSPFVLLTGLPGSGKTSLLEMVRDGLGKTRFVRVRCIELVDRKMETVADAVMKALTDKPQEENAASVPLRQRLSQAFLHAVKRAQRKEERLVLVLDDADFCITAFTEAGIPEQERRDAREFWASLAEQSRAGSSAVVVTSLAGSLLSSTVIDGWANPLANQARVLRVGPLEAGDIRKLCTELGRQINVTFDTRALALITELSAGNVSVVRGLCGAAVRARRQERAATMLQSVHVGRADVQRAAQQLIHTGDEFRSSLLPWLGPLERRLMELVASQRTRTPAALRQAFTDAPEQCDAAFARLRHMGLIDHRDGRLTLTIPLLSMWVRHNFEPTAPEANRRQQRRIRSISLGVTLSLLLFGGYYLASQPGEVAWTSAKCQGQILYPSRTIPGQEEILFISRECNTEAPPDAEPLRLMARMGTFARVDKADTSRVLQGEGRPESIPADWRRLELPVTFRDVGRTSFELELQAANKSVATLVIRKDWVANLSGFMKALLALAGAIPALLGLLLSFHQEVSSKVRKLFPDERAETAPQPPPSG